MQITSNQNKAVNDIVEINRPGTPKVTITRIEKTGNSDDELLWNVFAKRYIEDIHGKMTEQEFNFSVGSLYSICPQNKWVDQMDPEMKFFCESRSSVGALLSFGIDSRHFV